MSGGAYNLLEEFIDTLIGMYDRMSAESDFKFSMSDKDSMTTLRFRQTLVSFELRVVTANGKSSAVLNRHRDKADDTVLSSKKLQEKFQSLIRVALE